MGAIIPALMHRIPSELRSQACLGESSTRMSDLLGSPRVAPLHPFFPVFHFFFGDFVPFISIKRRFNGYENIFVVKKINL